MKKKGPIILSVLTALVFMGLFALAASAGDTPRMTKEELKAMMDDPNLVILDVRTGGDWKDSESKIKGAIREEPREVKVWAKKYDKSKTYVLYCA